MLKLPIFSARICTQLTWTVTHTISNVYHTSTSIEWIYVGSVPRDIARYGLEASAPKLQVTPQTEFANFVLSYRSYGAIARAIGLTWPNTYMYIASRLGKELNDIWVGSGVYDRQSESINAMLHILVEKIKFAQVYRNSSMGASTWRAKLQYGCS